MNKNIVHAHTKPHSLDFVFDANAHLSLTRLSKDPRAHNDDKYGIKPTPITSHNQNGNRAHPIMIQESRKSSHLHKGQPGQDSRYNSLSLHNCYDELSS